MTLPDDATRIPGELDDAPPDDGAAGGVPPNEEEPGGGEAAPPAVPGGWDVAAAAAKAAERAVRKRLDAEATAALTAALSGAAAAGPLADDPAAGGPAAEDTWADRLRAHVRTAVATSLHEVFTPPDPGAEADAGPDVPADADPTAGGGEDVGLPLDCPDLPTWVEEIYAPTYIRRISQTQRWCARWWAHDEAAVRLQALWQTWETARVAEDPAAMADWLRLYLDALNPVLLSADGPFASCTPDRHADPVPLPLHPPPPDWEDFGPMPADSAETGVSGG